MMVTPAEPVRRMQVTVFVDISSPWAYVGHLTLNEALRACADLPFDIDVECRPFQLETLDALPEGASVDRRELWLKHHGRPNGVSRLQGCVERAKYHGVALRLGSKVAQSKKAQRLLLLAYRRGGQTVQQPLLHAILRSCHEDEACCDDSDMLARCAQAVDLMPRDAALSFLKSEDLRCEVECMMREARDLGITATPSIVFGGKWAVTGAQSPNVYSRILRHLAACGHESVPVSFPLYPAIA